MAISSNIIPPPSGINPPPPTSPTNTNSAPCPNIEGPPPPEGCANHAKNANTNTPQKTIGSFTIIYPSFGKEVNLNNASNGFDIHYTTINKFEDFGQKFIQIMSGIVVLITILVFMIGGGFWIFSAGNESLVERGKGMMIYSTIGILLVLGAYVVVKVVQIILYSLGT